MPAGGASNPKRIAPSQLKRKEKRAADPAVRQRAAAHAAAAEAAHAAAVEAALAAAPAEQAGAGAAGLAREKAGRSCRSCGEPTAGHVGPYRPSCAAAKTPPTPENIRSTPGSLTLSPVRGDGRKKAAMADTGVEGIDKQIQSPSPPSCPPCPQVCNSPTTWHPEPGEPNWEFECNKCGCVTHLPVPGYNIT